MATRTTLRGPCIWGDEVGVPAANQSRCLLTHSLNGGHIANFGSGSTSTGMRPDVVRTRATSEFERSCEVCLSYIILT